MAFWSDSRNILNHLSNLFRFLRNMGLNGSPRQPLALAEHYIKTLPQISKSLFLSLPVLLHFCKELEVFGTSHNKSCIFTMFSQNKEITVLHKWSLRNTASLYRYKIGLKTIVSAKEKPGSVSTWCTHMHSSPGAELHSCIAQQGVRNNIQYIIFFPTGMKWS